jgi:hypothetical protein
MSSSINVYCTITTLNDGKKVPLTVQTDATPTQLRENVSEATKIPLAQLRLIFRGRMIKDDDSGSTKVIPEYKLESDCVLHCMGKPSSSGGDSTTNAAAAAASTTTTTATTAGPTVSVPTSASAPQAAAASVQDPLQTALQTLMSSNAPSVYMTAVSTLEKILSNIGSHPMEDKYRKVKQLNAAFQKRLGGLPGGDMAMRAVGFVLEQQEGHPVYQLHAAPDAWPKLMAAKARLQAAVQEAQRASSAAAAPPSAAAAQANNNSFGMPAAGGMPGGMPAGMPNMANMDPMMQSAMADMMSNPDGLRNMLQVRSFFECGTRMCAHAWLTDSQGNTTRLGSTQL